MLNWGENRGKPQQCEVKGIRGGIGIGKEEEKKLEKRRKRSRERGRSMKLRIDRGYRREREGEGERFLRKHLHLILDSIKTHDTVHTQTSSILFSPAACE